MHASSIAPGSMPDVLPRILVAFPPELKLLVMAHLNTADLYSLMSAHPQLTPVWQPFFYDRGFVLLDYALAHRKCREERRATAKLRTPRRGRQP